MKPDFSKYTDGLIPAIVQDANTQKVLMLGFMNEEAVQKTEYDANSGDRATSCWRLVPFG